MCPLQLASSRKPLYIHPPVTQAWVLRFSKTRRFDALHRATARMAKLVDAWDLKSPVRKDVPVRFRLRAPNKSGACMRFFVQALCFCSAILKAVPQFFIFAPPLAYCQSTKIQDIPATAKPLAPHARRHMATPLNIAAFSGARCNRIAIDAHSVVGAARDLDQATAAKLGPSPG